MRTRIPFDLLATSVAVLFVLGASGCARKAAEAPPAPTTPPPTTAPAAPAGPAAPEAGPPAPATPAQEAQGLLPAFFDFDSHVLRGDARAALDHDARLLRDDTRIQVTVEGHCDERGTVEYNLALGDKRAQAARDYLIAAGVSGDRIEVVSYGKERPFDDGHDEVAWAKNRRAHLVRR